MAGQRFPISLSVHPVALWIKSWKSFNNLSAKRRVHSKSFWAMKYCVDTMEIRRTHQSVDEDSVHRMSRGLVFKWCPTMAAAERSTRFQLLMDGR
jgi:hypothetical protein